MTQPRITVYRDGCGGHDPKYPWFVASISDTETYEYGSFATHAEAFAFAYRWASE